MSARRPGLEMGKHEGGYPIRPRATASSSGANCAATLASSHFGRSESAQSSPGSSPDGTSALQSLAGGWGGMFIGTLIIAIITGGMVLLGFSQGAGDLSTGFLIIAVGIVDLLVQRTAAPHGLREEETTTMARLCRDRCRRATTERACFASASDLKIVTLGVGRRPNASAGTFSPPLPCPRGG